MAVHGKVSIMLSPSVVRPDRPMEGHGNAISLHQIPWPTHDITIEAYGAPWRSEKCHENAVGLRRRSLETHGSSWQCNGMLWAFI